MACDWRSQQGPGEKHGLASCIHAQPKLAAPPMVLAPPAAVANVRTLPSESELQRVAKVAYGKCKVIKDGANADYIPELAKGPSDLVGVVIATADGKVYAIDDVDRALSIQSLSKPFTAALVMQERGDP